MNVLQVLSDKGNGVLVQRDNARTVLSDWLLREGLDVRRAALLSVSPYRGPPVSWQDQVCCQPLSSVRMWSGTICAASDWPWLVPWAPVSWLLIGHGHPVGRSLVASDWPWDGPCVETMANQRLQGRSNLSLTVQGWHSFSRAASYCLMPVEEEKTLLMMVPAKVKWCLYSTWNTASYP